MDVHLRLAVDARLRPVVHDLMPKQAAHFIPMRDRLATAVRHWAAIQEQLHHAEVHQRELANTVRDNPTVKNGEALRSAITLVKAKERLLENAREEYESVLEQCMLDWRSV